MRFGNRIVECVETGGRKGKGSGKRLKVSNLTGIADFGLRNAEWKENRKADTGYRKERQWGVVRTCGVARADDERWHSADWGHWADDGGRNLVYIACSFFFSNTPWFSPSMSWS